MENLNAEQIKKQMQEWSNSICKIACMKDFYAHGRIFTCENCFSNTVKNALALIKELTDELDDAKRDTIPKLQWSLERANEMGAEADRKVAELTKENESWQKSLITQKENANKAYYELACEVENLRAENERLRAENENKCKDCAGCIADKCDCANIEAYAVEKYKSAIIQYYSQPKYQPTKEHPIKHTQIEYLFMVLDQIAKEMLEDKLCT